MERSGVACLVRTGMRDVQNTVRWRRTTRYRGRIFHRLALVRQVW